MNDYPFLIRGPTHTSRVRKIKANGKNFKDALIRVLSVYPSKFVNFKFARNMDLNSVKQIAINLSKKTKGVEHVIWLNEKEGEFYISFKNDKGFTILVEDETNLKGLEIGSARLNKFSKQSTWLNGEQIAEAEPAAVEKPSKRKAGKRPVNVIPELEPETELKNKSTKKTTAAADSADDMKNKKSVKPGKAAKADKKNGAKVELKTVTGDKKTLSVKAILALQKKGTKVYRQSNPNSGGILIQKRLAKYANQEKTIAVIVAKA